MSNAVSTRDLLTGGSRASWAFRIAYGLAVAVAAGLASLLVVVATGPLFSNGEAWETFAIGWSVWGIPAALAGGALSPLVLYPTYMQQKTWVGSALLFIANLVTTVVIVLALAVWGAGI